MKKVMFMLVYRYTPHKHSSLNGQEEIRTYTIAVRNIFHVLINAFMISLSHAETHWLLPSI